MKKKELLYKNQILPSQLMCKDRKGREQKNSSWDFGEQCGEKKERGRKMSTVESPVVVSPFLGEGSGKVSDQPDLKPDKTISTCQ